MSKYVNANPARDGGQVALDEIVPNGSTVPVVGPWILCKTCGPAIDGFVPISIQLVTDDDLQGAWKIEGSNNSGVFDGLENNPADVTGAFTGPDGNPVADVTGPSSQGLQPGGAGSFGFYALRVSFIPASGGGNPRAYMPYMCGATRERVAFENA